MWTCPFKFRVVEGSARGKVFPLHSPTLTIGRVHSDAVSGVTALLIPDDTVSRIQAELVWQEAEQKFLLRNRSETNPTQVNGQVVQEALLARGDQIRMGLCVLDLQEADMRFGGDPTKSAARRASLSAAAPPLPPRASDDEQRISTKRASRTASLTHRPDFSLELVDGPQKGERHDVTGLTIALGGGPLPAPAPDKKDVWWDQDLVLTGVDVAPRALGLRWKELQGGFELFRSGGAAVAVRLERHRSGLDWSCDLPPDRPAPGTGATPPSALVRPGDVLRIGPHAVRITLP